MAQTSTLAVLAGRPRVVRGEPSPIDLDAATDAVRDLLVAPAGTRTASTCAGPPLASRRPSPS